MKAGKYTEEQIIAVLREGESRRALPQARDERSHLLQLESQVRRYNGQRPETAQGPGSREPAFKTNCGRSGAG